MVWEVLKGKRRECEEKERGERDRHEGRVRYDKGKERQGGTRQGKAGQKKTRQGERGKTGRDKAE